jgi:hypothetical protein
MKYYVIQPLGATITWESFDTLKEAEDYARENECPYAIFKGEWLTSSGCV